MIMQTYILLRTYSIPPATVPYLSLFYGIAEAISSFIWVVSEFLEDDVDAALVGVQILSLILSSIFVFVAGSLPVQRVRPALNVAQYKDVRSFLVSSWRSLNNARSHLQRFRCQKMM